MTPAAPSSASPDIGFAESSLGQSLLRVLAEGSVSNRAIADYVLRNQVRVTALGIEELADACDVSTATISRFARDLGFRNYAAMRGAVAETLQSVLQPVEKLRSTIARRAAKASPALESLGYAEAAITATSRALAGTQIDRIGAVLTKARTVYVLGFGLSSFLAGALAMHLQPFCRHVVEAAASGGTLHAGRRVADPVRARCRRDDRLDHRFARVAARRTGAPRAVRAQHAPGAAQQFERRAGRHRGAGRVADDVQQGQRGQGGPPHRGHRRLSAR